MTTKTFLPYGRQEITDEDVEAVAEALRSPLITQGPLIDRFEEAIADYLGARHAVAFANGTAALHGAAFAAGIGPGDEALVSPLTFAASSNCVLYQGGTPRFVDVDPATLNIDPVATREAVTDATRALVAVSFAGMPAPISELAPLRDHGITIIEDAAHAIGAERDGGKVGGPGGADLTTFSLHPVKTMTTGEGGLVTTEDDELARRLRLFRTHGITKDGMHPGEHEGDWYYEMQALGFNYRITDFQCALGLSQLRRLDRFVERRNEVADIYHELLAGEQRIVLPPRARPGDRHGYHLFPIQVRGGMADRRATFDALRAEGIGVQVHYIPVYRLPYYRDELGYPQDGFPNTDRYYSGAISLPMYPGLSDDDVARVADTLGEVLP